LDASNPDISTHDITQTQMEDARAGTSSTGNSASATPIARHLTFEQDPVQLASPPSEEPDLDNEHDKEAPLRFRKVDNLLGGADPPGPVEHALIDELLLATEDEPWNFDEARGEECRRKAMLEEMGSIEENGTWFLTGLPAGHRPIGLKWVFKIKRDEKGNIAKHKARLVAKGYVQQPGVDFEEVFAPVARMESVRVLLAVAAHQDWLVHHMDVRSTFLNGELEEDVYVLQPPGFIAVGHEGKVLKLKKAPYGLRQAPRAWNTKLDASLRDIGFTRCVNEHGLYTRGLGAERLVVVVYVDDLVITGASPKEILAFKEEMRHLFRMSDLGLLSFYLGIEVKQTGSSISLCQAAYAKKLLEKVGLGSCNPTQAPMEARFKLSKNSGTPDIDTTMYRSLVGSLRYLVHTRPDIMFAVGYVSRFMERP
jgi:hypothetical protein